MEKTINNFFYSVFAVLLFLFIFPHCSSADAARDIAISPYIIDERVYPKDILEYNVKLKNNDSLKADIYVFVNDILVTDGEQESVSPGKADRTLSLANWIEIKRAATQLDPGQETNLPLKIEVAPNAETGKRFAVITFVHGSNRPDAEKNKDNKRGTELLVNIEVKENIIEKMQINKFIAFRNLYFKYPVELMAVLENFGNRTVSPGGSIYIYNRRGEEIDEIRISNDEYAIEPGKKIEISKAWSPAGGFGKFKAKINIEYGQTGNQDLQDSTFFWVLPYYFLIIVGFAMLILAVTITHVLFRKSYPGNYYKDPRLINGSNNGVINLKNKK